MGIKHPRFFSTTRNCLNTIYALSTSREKAAIAVVRVSGPESLTIAHKLILSRPEAKHIRPRTAHLVKLYDPKKPSNLLDNALMLYFKAPHSYTGEDLVEFHLHGGNAVVKAVLGAIASFHTTTHSVRSAEPGEFTMRAFRNSKLDLTQVEGIRDIIDAETEYQRQAAVGSADGKAKHLFNDWRKAIVHNIASCAVLIDFADDNYDIKSEDESAGQNALLPSVVKNVNGLLDEIKHYQNSLQVSELLTAGIKINFLGPPNVGKSSLLNLLVKRDAAIVSEVPGTTRDVVEVAIDLAGYKVVLGDTAGVRDLDHKLAKDQGHTLLEAEGIKRAISRLSSGDITVVVASVDVELSQSLSIIKEELQTLKATKPEHRVILVINKLDLLEGNEEDHGKLRHLLSTELLLSLDDIVSISSKTAYGLMDLTAKITSICQQMTHPLHTGDLSPLGASQRVKDLLENNVIAGLEQFLLAVNHDDIVAGISELEFAADGIGKITGENVTVDEVLGVVFGSFCIGK